VFCTLLKIYENQNLLSL